MMKKCPFCAEEIQDEAVKCKHCGSELTANSLQHVDNTKLQPNKNRLFPFLTIAFLLLAGAIYLYNSNYFIGKQEIINAVKSEYGYNDIDYKLKINNIENTEELLGQTGNEFENSDKVALVEIYSMKSGKNWIKKFGRSKTTQNWKPTNHQKIKDSSEKIELLQGILNSIR